MSKTILITGATDGIGLATAHMLAAEGHNLLIHGRNAQKLTDVEQQLTALAQGGKVQTYLADLSNLADVRAMATKIKAEHNTLDVLINNAGVLKVANPIASDGLDVRFNVNTLAPYILAQQLAPILTSTGRVINLSSAAQAPVNLDALRGKVKLSDMEAYSQSKLAITMWSMSLAKRYQNTGPAIIAVNPGSLLASKMVKDGFGVAGNDISIGAKILVRMSLEDGLEKHSGEYFDNDKGDFGPSHPDGRDLQKSDELVEVMDAILAGKSA